MSEQTTLLTRMRDRRLSCWEQAKGVSEKAFEEHRAMTGEEERQFKEWDDEISRIDVQVQDIEAGEKRAAAFEEATSRVLGQPAAPGVDPGGTPSASPAMSYEQENEEFRKLCGMAPGAGLDFAWPSTYERRTMTNPGAYESRALAVAGVPMPTSFIHQLYNYLVDTSSIRQAGATVISTQTGESITVPRSTGEGSATWVAEAAALPTGDPVLGSISLGSHKLGKLIQVSKELATDVGFDLVGFLAQSSGRNIGIASNAGYVSGTGGGTQPTGLLTGISVGYTAAITTGATAGLPTATAGDYAFDVFVNMYHSIIPQYRPRASWMMNDTVIKTVRKVKDTLGRYIWEPSLQAGVPDTIMGKPVYANPALPLFGASVTGVILFGDFSAYYIRDVTPLRFERSDEYLFGSDQIAFRALLRTDGALVDANAVKAYATPAS
jgi:HK97 family phage major capsid protein